MRRAAFLVAAALATGCAAPPAPRVAPPAPTPAGTETPAPTPVPSAAATPVPRVAPLPTPALGVALATDRASASFPAGDWILAAAGRFERRRGPLVVAPAGAGLRVTDDGTPSDWPSPLEIVPTNGSPVPWSEATYRGRLQVRATARGTLHVVNRVGLEDYL